MAAVDYFGERAGSGCSARFSRCVEWRCDVGGIGRSHLYGRLNPQSLESLGTKRVCNCALPCTITKLGLVSKRNLVEYVSCCNYQVML